MAPPSVGHGSRMRSDVLAITALPTVVRRAPRGRGAVLLTRQRDADAQLPFRVLLLDGGGRLISGAAFTTAEAAGRAFEELAAQPERGKSGAPVKASS